MVFISKKAKTKSTHTRVDMYLYLCIRYLQENRKEHREEGAEASPRVTSVFFGAQQSVFSFVLSRVVVFKNNFIPKPPCLLLFISICVAKVHGVMKIL